MFRAKNITKINPLTRQKNVIKIHRRKFRLRKAVELTDEFVTENMERITTSKDMSEWTGKHVVQALRIEPETTPEQKDIINHTKLPPACNGIGQPSESNDDGGSNIDDEPVKDTKMPLTITAASEKPVEKEPEVLVEEQQVVAETVDILNFTPSEYKYVEIGDGGKGILNAGSESIDEKASPRGWSANSALTIDDDSLEAERVELMNLTHAELNVKLRQRKLRPQNKANKADKVALLMK
jgi:hypothetical protein